MKFQKIFRTAILQNNYEWLFWYIEITIRINTATWHCVKHSQIRSFFLSIFSRIRTELEDLCSKSPYSTRIRENTGQKNICVCALFPHWVNIRCACNYGKRMKERKKQRKKQINTERKNKEKMKTL